MSEQEEEDEDTGRYTGRKVSHNQTATVDIQKDNEKSKGIMNLTPFTAEEDEADHI